MQTTCQVKCNFPALAIADPLAQDRNESASTRGALSPTLLLILAVLSLANAPVFHPLKLTPWGRANFTGKQLSIWLTAAEPYARVGLTLVFLVRGGGVFSSSNWL